jgi:CRISPR type I-E-associated protein CasB/Cse2
VTPTPTEKYIQVVTHLKSGELAILREHAGRGLDESVEAFDLFAGLWWPLREKNQRAPRRGVAWLIAKLYAFRPIEHSSGETLAYQLGRCREDKDADKDPVRQRFDSMLTLPVERIEPALQWALDLIASKRPKLDWVRLTNDLSIWERETTRLKWAEDFLKPSKEDCHVN